MRTDAFQTFVINLDRDTERMAFMDGQLARLGIPYERISAFRGSDPEAIGAYDAEAAYAQGGYRLGEGEIGCAASHRRAYELVAERGLAYALILEDDVELPEGFPAILEREISRNTGAWEYLLFDYWEPGTVARGLWYGSARSAVRAGFASGPLRGLVASITIMLKGMYVLPLLTFESLRDRYKRKHPGPVTFYRPLYLAGAYLVTAEGARKLLALSTPIRFTADRLPNQARVQSGLKFKAYAPQCVRQLKRTFGSSILGMSGDELMP